MWHYKKLKGSQKIIESRKTLQLSQLIFHFYVLHIPPFKPSHLHHGLFVIFDFFLDIFCTVSTTNVKFGSFVMNIRRRYIQKPETAWASVARTGLLTPFPV